MRPPKRHRRTPARDTPRQSASKKPRKVNASAPDRCNEANTRSSSAPRAPSTQTALEVTLQSSASGPQQHLSISHGPVVNIVSEVQSYRPGNQERSQSESIGTTSSTPLNPQSSSSGNPPPQSSNIGMFPQPLVMSDSTGGIDVSGSLDISLESQMQVNRSHDVMPSIFDPISSHIPLKLKENAWKGDFIDFHLLSKSARELANEQGQGIEGDLAVKGGL